MSQKISAMTPAGTLNGTEQLPVIRGGPPNLRTTTAAIAALGGGPTGLTLYASGDTVTVTNCNTISVAPGSGLHLSSAPGSTSVTLTLADATANTPGEVSSGSQTFGGIKAFQRGGSFTSYLIADGGLSGFGVFGWQDPVNSPGCFSGWHLGAREADLELSDATFTQLMKVKMNASSITLDVGTGGRYAVGGVNGIYATNWDGSQYVGGLLRQAGSAPSPPPSTALTITAPGDGVTVPTTMLFQIASGSGLHLSSPGSNSATLTMADATGTTPGEVSAGNQTIGGQKMFLAAGISSVGLNVVGGPTSQAGTFFGSSSTPATPQSGISYSANTVQMEVFLPGGSRFSRLTSSAGATHFELAGTATDTFAFAVPAGPGGYGTGSGGDSFAGGLWMSAGTPPPASIAIGSTVGSSSANYVLFVNSTFVLDEISPTSNVGWVMTSNGLSAAPTFQALPAAIVTIGATVGGGPTANLPLYVDAASTLQQLTLSESVIISAGVLQLVGDSASPGALMYYGTDNTAVKGWHSFPPALTNPMTTTGDMIYSVDNAGTPGRLGIGSAGTLMYVVSGIPGWTGTGITVNNATPDLVISGGGGGVTISGGSGGNVVSSDGTNRIVLTDGTWAAQATSGSIKTIGTTGNTFAWNNSASAPSTLSTAGVIAFGYGRSWTENVLGEPDGWVLINVGGTNVLLPAYLP